MFRMLIIAITILFAAFSFAETGCNDKGIQAIQIPVYAGNANSPKFKYSYRIRPGALNKPYIIVLGGGPGQNTIAPGSAPILGAFPENYSLVYTDPRSVGCNNTYSFSDDALSSLALADDVATLISHLLQQKILRQPYFIYGASFGTQHATILTKRLKQKGIPLPQGVVLEGVSGHHYSGFNEYFKHFQTEWERIKQQDLQPGVRKFFESPLPTNSSNIGYSSKVWGQFLSLQIILGYLPQAGQKFRHLIDWYLTDPDGQAASVPQLNGLFQGTNDGKMVPVEKLFRVIGCREIWGEFYPGRDIVAGHLIATGENVCKYMRMDQPYNSKSWQIPVPIYYFQGMHDPTTTLNQATYHFENQSSQRQMIVVERASHGPLSVALRPCANQLWDTITVNPKKLQEVAKACGRALGTNIQFLSKD